MGQKVRGGEACWVALPMYCQLFPVCPPTNFAPFSVCNTDVCVHYVVRLRVRVWRTGVELAAAGVPSQGNGAARVLCCQGEPNQRENQTDRRTKPENQTGLQRR